MAYINTKENNEHYRGKVWVTKSRSQFGKNVCVDMGRDELKVIAYVTVITETAIENAIEAMGWRKEDWLN